MAKVAHEVFRGRGVDWNDLLPVEVAKLQRAWERKYAAWRMHNHGHMTYRQIAERMNVGIERARQLALSYRLPSPAEQYINGTQVTGAKGNIAKPDDLEHLVGGLSRSMRKLNKAKPACRKS